MPRYIIEMRERVLPSGNLYLVGIIHNEKYK